MFNTQTKDRQDVTDRFLLEMTTHVEHFNGVLESEKAHHAKLNDVWKQAFLLGDQRQQEFGKQVRMF